MFRRHRLAQQDIALAAPKAQTVLIQVNAAGGDGVSMACLIFRCTRTGVNVQLSPPEEAPDEADSYEAVTCPACTRIHFVNKTTGKMLGDSGK
jgi:hypothetical protein